MKTIFLSLILLTLVSCSKDNTEPVNAYVQSQIGIRFVNSNNENLFDSSTLGHYKINDVKLYNIINNLPVEANDTENGNVELSEGELLYLIIYSNINPNNGGVLIFEEGNSKIYEFNSLLKLSDNITDSIKTHVEKKKVNESTSLVVKKVWYNDRLVGDNYLTYFDIIK